MHIMPNKDFFLESAVESCGFYIMKNKSGRSWSVFRFDHKIVAHFYSKNDAINYCHEQKCNF